MLVDRGDLAVYDQNQSQYLHSVPKIDKRLLKPGSYKNPKNLCFCLSVLFMYCRRKVSAVKIGDGVVFISSKSQKRESQMMASIRDRLCISYDQKKFHSTTFSNMPGSTERQASQDDLMEQDGQAGDMQGGLLLLPDLNRLLALVVVLLHGGLVHQAARSRLPLCSLSQHLVVPVRTTRN